MTELRAPTFDPELPTDDRLTMLCPCCESDYTHHGRVEVYNRGEDSLDGLHVSVGLSDVRADTDLSGNPSDRRHGLRIRMSCEACGQTSWLVIAQHKGQTHVWCEVDSAEATEWE